MAQQPQKSRLPVHERYNYDSTAHDEAVTHRNRRHGAEARRRRALLREQCGHIESLESGKDCGISRARHGKTHNLGHEFIARQLGWWERLNDNFVPSDREAREAIERDLDETYDDSLADEEFLSRGRWNGSWGDPSDAELIQFIGDDLFYDRRYLL